MVSQKSGKNLPSFGWEKDDDGWLSLPDDFAQGTAFISQKYSDWSEKMRARWNIFDYIRVFFDQQRNKKRKTKTK